MTISTLVLWLIAGIGIGLIARRRTSKTAQLAFKPVRIKNSDPEKH